MAEGSTTMRESHGTAAAAAAAAIAATPSPPKADKNAAAILAPPPSLEVSGHEEEEDDVKPEDQAGDGEFRWEHPAILLLLSLYKCMEGELTSGKVSMKKFWEKISSQLVEKGHNITGPQCKSKLNGMKKTYKSVKDHNNRSGNSRRTWPYFELMDEIFGSKPWVAPVCTLQSSSSNIPSPPESRAASPLPIQPPRKRAKSCATATGNDQAVLEALQANANQRAQMHRDAMARQDKLQEILAQLIPKP